MLIDFGHGCADVRPIDMSSEAELLQAFDLECAATSELRGPSWSPLPADVRLRRWTSTSEFAYYLVGAWRGADLVGLGQRTFWSGEPDDYFVGVVVDSACRRKGIGARLVRHLEADVTPGARRFLAMPFLANHHQLDTLTEGFASATGYRLGTVEVCMEVDLAGDAIPSATAPNGWRVATYVDGIPPELLDEVGVVRGLLEEQAPSGEIEWNAHAMTPQEYHAELEEILAEGSQLIEALAFSPDGRVAGWTGLTTAETADRPARVLGTLGVA